MHRTLAAGVTLAALLAPCANADTRFWHIQNTGYYHDGNDGTALALRNGSVWPTIFTDDGRALAQFATGWTDLVPFNVSLFPRTYDMPLRATSSADHRVTVTTDDQSSGSGYLSNNGVTLSRTGFTPLPDHTLAADYGPDGNLYLLLKNPDTSDRYVPGLPDPEYNDYHDIAVSPFGEVGLIDDRYGFAEYSPLRGDWQYVDFYDLPDPDNRFNNFTAISLEYDALGRPHVLGELDNQAAALDYHPATGWTLTDFTQDLTLNGTFDKAYDLAADSLGNVGTALYLDGFESTANALYYLHHDGDEWSAHLVENDTNLDIRYDAQFGIAYDHEDLPVISYVTNGTIHLAYDPIIVPEPAALTLLSLTALTLARRTR
ncbi:hypothetical protein [Mucisphaera calidilacus]|uniref:PEP-CTERM protein-sorting domain-containing protein n=1 Tax=Mucisphaera calidilacus TaxID=2527982 RepID=A0A518C035_9BACT|nr:hypothetical protein [Mucisphaera calidilacus]QDU72580.1 hypothetical protein Pan265_24500 [Mucisphaera calidilacus]